MATTMFKAFSLLALASASAVAMAQYVATPPPGDLPPPPASGPGPTTASSGGRYLRLEPKNGQSEQQQWQDRYECHRWARTQSGFDPTQQSAGAGPNESPGKADEYRRAMTACLESHGYVVHYGAAPVGNATAPPPLPALGSTRVRTVSDVPELRYRPLTVQLDGGYSASVGKTDRLLDDGGNVGLGLTWFPTSALPVGLRVDGSWSSFRARNEFRQLYGPDFSSGHDNIYGGDADLQLDLARNASWMKLYLFGGAGWYREQAYLRENFYFQGDCGFHFCGPGYFGWNAQRTTSPWHSSWNAGLGWEVTTGGLASFFVEARYQRIAAFNETLQFVPIRIGVRF